MTPPPATFTPKHEAAEVAITIAVLWGVVSIPECGFVDKRHILCSVNFPPIKGKYLGWDLTLAWDGHKITPHPTIVPEL